MVAPEVKHSIVTNTVFASWEPEERTKVGVATFKVVVVVLVVVVVVDVVAPVLVVVEVVVVVVVVVVGGPSSTPFPQLYNSEAEAAIRKRTNTEMKYVKYFLIFFPQIL